ncbi:MAG: hypothetical protein LDL33_12075 [Desulfomonile sp.]|nr:hypothetical protein [Desulfomonile sp.]
MKRNFAAMACCIFITAAAMPAHAFLNYLFGGDSSREAVENSALGDLRAWWTGNPVYTFDPFYSGQTPQAPQGRAPSAGYGQQQPAPIMQYIPPQQAPAGQYGQYGQPMQPAPQAMYGPPMQQPMPPQAMQQPMPMQPMQPQAYGAPYQGGPAFQGGALQYGGGEQSGGVRYYQQQ